jgi:hypothetical protein
VNKSRQRRTFLGIWPGTLTLGIDAAAPDPEPCNSLYAPGYSRFIMVVRFVRGTWRRPCLVVGVGFRVIRVEDDPSPQAV